MMTITIEMPSVSDCSAEECAYNTDNQCHARAITVGDGAHPGCDTFFHASAHNRETRRIAGVGACKVTGCLYNEDYECQSDSISVGQQGGSIQCLTYSAKA